MPNSSLLKALEKITTAQQAGVKRMGESQNENMFMQLIKTLINKVEIAKGDKGDKPVAGIDYFIPKNGIDGEIGAKGEKGDSIKGEKGIVGKTGAIGATGKDGKDASVTEMKSISDKEAKKAIKEHDKEYDHKNIHKSVKLGELELDEESIKEGAILQIKGNKLVAVDMPKAQQPYFARPAAAHSRYQIQTITKSTTIDPLMNVVLIDASGGNIALTMYEASGNEGSYTFFKRIDDSANTVSFATQNSENFEFETAYQLVNAGSGCEAFSDGSNFYIKHS